MKIKKNCFQHQVGICVKTNNESGKMSGTHRTGFRTQVSNGAKFTTTTTTTTITTRTVIRNKDGGRDRWRDSTHYTTHAASRPSRNCRSRRQRGHAAAADGALLPPFPLHAGFLNIASTSIPGVPIGRPGSPPAEPIGRAARRCLAGKFDFDRFPARVTWRQTDSVEHRSNFAVPAKLGNVCKRRLYRNNLNKRIIICIFNAKKFTVYMKLYIVWKIRTFFMFWWNKNCKT